jgi:UDP-glucuronate decarboxylase
LWWKDEVIVRLLVTGGAGFIGSNLCSKLLGNGHYIICLDNFYSSSESTLDKLRKNSNFETIRHDINFPIYLEVDGIINLACPASPVYYQRDPVQTLKTCIQGSINMLGLAKRLGIPILQASTSEVYGDPEVSPQDEEYWGRVNPVGIRSCYDEGKRAAETLFMDYHRRHKLDIKIARIFNTYGPNMQINDGRVVSNFIVQALQNNDITIYGDGKQTRSFCYIDDLVDALSKLFFKNDISFPINLGNPEEITVYELANEVIELTGSKSKIVYKPLPSDDPMKRKPNIDRAQKNLDWKPLVDRAKGLSKTIDYFRTIIN